jgi:hypothetical protein
MADGITTMESQLAGITSNGELKGIIICTQAEYDALTPQDGYAYWIVG